MPCEIWTVIATSRKVMEVITDDDVCLRSFMLYMGNILGRVT